ncbi:phytoene desaturase family protein [Brachybacterium sp. J153]|uniref:phytoene desaturase family protein n=1 Tax=Brachybacterium sp. J153 TaxID=3116488 RepID=UPI002E7A34C7|nr:phytoene desaturase family protein [Brachybacterium sp. J153]MEE1618574.1 phytoene desaturase family protein [Brachybacterium sp. J153]
MNAPGSVVVIGGGISGLATAALLARDGWDVDLVEARDAVGGRAGTWERDGFRFDTGPSWYLMPEVFDHFFRLLGSSAAEQLDLRPLDPGYRVLFDGHEEPLDVTASAARNADLFEQIEPGAGRRLSTYLDEAARTYDLALEHFLYTSFDSPRSLLAPAVLLRAPRLLGLLLRSLESHIARRIDDPRLRQVLGYPAVFLGSSPDRTPSMYHLMSALDLTGGVRYPMGGFGQVIERIAALAVREGVRVHTSTRAERILTEPARPGAGRRRARARGVEVVGADGGRRTIRADRVVATADLHHVETTMLPPSLRTYPERWWERRTSGPGAVLAMLGVRGELPQLEHHTLLFTADWRENFGALREGRVPRPASSYVCRPSATDPSVAPSGHENLFVLVPVPSDPALGRGGIDGSGDAAVERIADDAIARLAANAGIPDLADRIVVRRTVGPGDFAADLGAWRGSMLGPAHTLRQSAFLRAGNVSRHVDGLLYAGSGTIPGIGLPMCLISAELVVKRLRADRSSGPLPEPKPSSESESPSASGTGGRR